MASKGRRVSFASTWAAGATPVQQQAPPLSAESRTRGHLAGWARVPRRPCFPRRPRSCQTTPNLGRAWAMPASEQLPLLPLLPPVRHFSSSLGAPRPEGVGRTCAGRQIKEAAGTDGRARQTGNTARILTPGHMQPRQGTVLQIPSGLSSNDGSAGAASEMSYRCSCPLCLQSLLAAFGCLCAWRRLCRRHGTRARCRGRHIACCWSRSATAGRC